MAKIPDNFYKQQETSQQSYTTNPVSGELAVERLINGKPDTWVDQNPHVTQKPKTLIFAHWLAGYCSSGEIKEIKDELSQLLQQGFTLYFHGNDGLSKIDQSFIDRIDGWMLRKIPQKSETEISDLAFKQHKLAKDDIYILDPLNYQRFQYEDPAQQTLKISASMLQRESDTINNTLSQSTYKLEFIQDILSNQDIQLRLQGVSQSVSANDSQYKQPTTLVIDGKINATSFSDDVLKSVTDVTLKNISQENQEVFAKIIAQTKVMSLNLSDSNITNDSLNNLLSHAAQLEALNLHDCENLTHIPEKLNLPKLKRIYLASSKMTNDSLNNLLSHAAQLEALNLHDCENLTHIPKELNLPQLKKITLSDSNMTNDSFNNLLSHAAQLEELTLYDCTNLTHIPKELNLSKLKRIDLSRSNMTNDSLNNLLSHAAQLEELYLSNCTNLTHIPKELNLPKLKRIDLSFSNMTGKDLNNLLSKTTDLQFIDISDCNKITGTDMTWLKQKYPHLEIKHSYPNVERNIISSTQTNSDSTSSVISQKEPDNKNYRAPSQSSTVQMDADVSFDQNKQFNVTQNLIHLDGEKVDVAQYRKSCYSSLEINPTICAADKAFTLKVDSAAQDKMTLVDDNTLLTNQVEVFTSAKNHPANENKSSSYHGRDKIRLTKTWLPLIGFSANDQLHQVLITDGVDPSQVELAKSSSDDLYYLRLKEQSNLVSAEIQVDYLLSASTNRFADASTIADLSDDVKRKIKALQGFSSKPDTSKITKENKTGSAHLQWMEENNLGACRHRAVIFKAYMDDKHKDIPTRIITNDVHAYVEINVNNQWQAIDLGGYEAQVNYTNQNGNFDEFKAVENNRIEKEKLNLLDLEIKAKPTYEYANALFQNQQQSNEKTQESKIRLQKMLASHKKNHLLEVPKDASIGLYKDLQAYCSSTQKPCFYINNPDELACAIQTIEHQENGTGVIKKAPSGALYDFIQKNQHNQAVLVVNYNNFKPRDIVRLNSLLDQDPHVDGIKIPENFKIIGLYDKSAPTAYQGADFSSRFDIAHDFKGTQASASVIKKSHEASSASNAQVIEVDLYHAQDWQDILFGRWQLKGQGLTYQKGVLNDCLKPNQTTTLQFKNMPKALDFAEFWQIATIQGEIKHHGLTIKLPENFEIIDAGEGYAFEDLAKQIASINADVGSDIPKDQPYILNPTTFNQFLADVSIDNNAKTLSMIEGIVEANKNKIIHVQLTRALSEDQWSRLLTHCQNHQVKLALHCDPSMVPETLTKQTDNLKSSFNLLNQKLLVIESPDPYFTHQDYLTLEDESKKVTSIYITDLNASDLLSKIDAKFNQENSSFEFQQKPQALQNRLESSNDQIILYGEFSDELSDQLVAFLAQHPEYQDRLCLIGSNMQAFAMAAQPKKVEITQENKLNLLERKYSNKRRLVEKLKTFAEKESYSQLETRLQYLIKHGENANSNEAWRGLDKLPVKIELGQLTEENVKEEAEKFQQKRIDNVEKVLEKAPYVFITGLTAVGKTTTITEHYAHQDQYCFYQSKEKMKDWAKDNTENKRKILFLDEANLNPTHWSEFEGLFHSPPSMVVDGELIKLSDQHKVIFAGNPLSYGDDRKLAPIFERHGNAVEFEPLNLAFIEHNVLSPLLKGTTVASKKGDVLGPILAVYHFLCERSKDEVLISPRELQMMLLLTLTHINEPDFANNAPQYARYYAYCIAKNAVPEKDRLDFETRFQVNRPKTQLKQEMTQIDEIPLNTKSDKGSHQDFIVTKSREPVKALLDDLLAVRALKQTDPTKAQYPGLGGLILEGEPGIGKSEIVIKSLVKAGLSEDQDFYRLPVSMPLKEKKEMLMKAFNAGAVVMIDEMNSAPMLEELLNALLMGKDLEGNSPKRPGFTVIATQNPASMAGRGQASSALSRRLLKAEIPAYTNDELQEIIQAKGFEKEDAQEMIQAFNENKSKNPQLCFRDFIKALKNLECIKKECIKKEMGCEEKANEGGSKDGESEKKEFPLIFKGHSSSKEGSFDR